MDVAKLNSKCVSREQESEYFSKSYYWLLYKRTSKERRKRKSSNTRTLSLYTIRLPPSNHFPCSDVPSESHPMILHTNPLFLIITTTPPLLTSQHLSSLPYLILNYTATISPLPPRLPTSPPFRNTIPSIPPEIFLHYS